MASTHRRHRLACSCLADMAAAAAVAVALGARDSALAGSKSVADSD